MAFLFTLKCLLSPLRYFLFLFHRTKKNEKRWTQYFNISDGLTNYTFFSTGETCPIKSNVSCETKNLIYMIQCNRCNLQYIGKTKRRLKDHFNEHRRTIDNPYTKSKPTTAAEHFLTAPNHTANDMQLIPKEKVYSNRDSIHKAREAFLISKGRTLLPYGLNIC